MPRAAAINDASSQPNCPARVRKPAAIFSIGKNSPMMPVDMTSACSACGAAGRGREAGHFAGVGRSPRSPVQALALPELIATARKPLPGVRERSRATGAAKTRFSV